MHTHTPVSFFFAVCLSFHPRLSLSFFCSRTIVPNNASYAIPINHHHYKPLKPSKQIPHEPSFTPVTPQLFFFYRRTQHAFVNILWFEPIIGLFASCY